MSCDAPEGSEQPDGKFAARDDTRWMKHGYSGNAEFRGGYAHARLSQRDGDPVVPRIQIHAVRTQNEVTISMAVNSQDDERDPHAGILATFTPDQIFALADALEEVAECAEEGIVADEQ